MSKYGNMKTGGFASKAEKRRSDELRLLERAGKIENIGMQVKYEVIPKQDGERAAHYFADFVYEDAATGETIVEDVKGVRTPVCVEKKANAGSWD
jgi:hypothetical protein